MKLNAPFRGSLCAVTFRQVCQLKGAMALIIYERLRTLVSRLILRRDTLPTSEALSAAGGFALPIFQKASVPALAGPARSVALLPTQMQPEYPYNFLA